MKRDSTLYDHCDVAMEEYPDRRITVLANEIGRASIQELIPETPIDWRRFLEGPIGWRSVGLRPSGPWLTYDAKRIGMEITRSGSRVLIKTGGEYEILSD
jgi:hypothetical protein